MKSILTILFFVAMFATPAWGQTSGDSSATQLDTSAQRSRFVDRDGNGIDDRKEGKGTRHGKDKFVDKDGDGICDGRESGLGFRGGKGDGSGKGRQWRGGKK
jgi:hypothetical protein